MTACEIIKKHLEDHGFDGLYTDECGCLLDDLMACGNDSSRCEPGYKIKCNNDTGYCTGLQICCGPKHGTCPQLEGDVNVE